MATAIRAFVGHNGEGKTLAAMVLAVEPALREGREVVSTCHIKHPRARVLQSWREVPALRDCVLVLDEISSQLPSRQSMNAPAQLVRMCQQLRKHDVELVWTAPNWARADVVLREVTREVTTCRAWVPDRWEREPGVVPPWWKPFAPAVRDEETGKRTGRRSRWTSKSLFRWRSYDAAGFDEFTLHAVKDVKPMSTTWYYRPWHTAQFLYETLEGVELLDHVDDVGVCMACGGARRRHPCTCSPSDKQAAALVAASAARAGRRSARGGMAVPGA